ncbi:hypothetical protein DFH08DRAFT_816829 [Mycena albidolilacea]|uniref:Uncharacterized protein n=1 Tax=Mycena albidolilacea TaxID=1033008 RepID=A0AAD6ZJ02_9AGAR|nr:hypothetical protein DFH08DRAFT_816829 [Mycena albidolilacea]
MILVLFQKYSSLDIGLCLPDSTRDTPYRIWLLLLFSVFLSLLLLLTPMRMQYPTPKPIGRTVFARLRQCIWKFFYRNMADPQIFHELRRSSICGKRRWLAYGYPVDLNIYISTIEFFKLDATPPVLKSVSYYRYAAPSRHALLLCRLCHSLYRPFVLVLEQWGNGCDMEAMSASSHIPESFTGCLSDKVTAIATPTEHEDSEFLNEPNVLCHTMQFPDSSPTLYDLEVLAVLVRKENPLNHGDSISCAFFAEMIYAGLEILFDSHSLKVDPDCTPPIPPSMAASKYEPGIQAVILVFPEPREEFQEKMAMHWTIGDTLRSRHEAPLRLRF